MTRFNFNEVFDMPAIEFLNYLTYYNFRKRREQKQLEDFRKQNKIK